MEETEDVVQGEEGSLKRRRLFHTMEELASTIVRVQVTATLETALHKRRLIDLFKPSLLRRTRTVCATKPLAPTSIVKSSAFQPFSILLILSNRGVYVPILRTWAPLMFSSAGQVSSIKKTFLKERDKINKSGLEEVLKISGGKT